MNRAQRNNNPLNLEFRGQKGAKKIAKERFAIFTTPQEGWQAAFLQIKLDQRRGLSFRDFIGKFAPPNENNTSQYLELVCFQLGVDPDDQLSERGRHAIAGVMAQEEGYFNILE